MPGTGRKYTVQQFYEMSDEQFRELYESPAHRRLLNFLETRIRLEIIAIVRRFKLKGELLFEVRQKSTASAYAKLQKELVSRQAEFGNNELYLFDIVQDIVGARVICMHEEVQKRFFEYILQVESVVILKEGLEFYSAPFREYTLSKDIHAELSKSVNSLASALSGKDGITKKSKPSNYESLHFYVKFDSKVDRYLLQELTDDKKSSSKGQRVRDAAEGKYLLDLHEGFSKDEVSIARTMPIEFQIRTITEHLWAQEEHKFIYKNISLPTDKEKNKQAIDVLKSTFTGLKFAYYNVDRLRSLVRNVAATYDTLIPSYTGSSKDFNPIRFTFFGDDRATIEKQYRDADNIYQEVKRNLDGTSQNGDTFIDVIKKLFEITFPSDRAETSSQNAIFDVRSWGKKRLFYLFLAYVALFAETKKLPLSVAKTLEAEIDLIDLIGDAAFQATVSDNEGSLKLASKLFERVATFDRISRTLNESDNFLKPQEASVFNDPLVGIRLASSFFLQGEFAGAIKALNDVFSLGETVDLTSWHSLDLASDFSLSEILMRYSQYLFFESFEDENKLFDQLVELQEVFKCIFELENTEYFPELYRCYCWYYALINYLMTQSPLIPETFNAHMDDCKEYLIQHYETAKIGSIVSKPEVLLALIYLSADHENIAYTKESIEEFYGKFSPAISKNRSYPNLANMYLQRMGIKLRDRAMRKLGKRKHSTFVSYSRRDLRLAEVAVAALRKCDLVATIDQDFDIGSDVTIEVERAMQDATSAILLVTPDYFKSAWATDERAFLMDKRRRKELSLYVVTIGSTQEDLTKNAPLLAGIKNCPADEENLESVVEELAQEILKNTD